MLDIDDAVAIRTPPTYLRRPGTWPTLAVALLPFVLLAVWRSFHGSGIRSDDFGQYLMHAQALAEGRPYGDIAYIYSKYARFVGPKLAPPGLPVTLAPFIAVFGANMVILKAVMLAFAIGFVAVAGAYFARSANWKLGLGVALLCGLSPDMVHGASQVLTDLPFAALIWILIYLIDLPGEFSARRIAAVTVLGVYAVALRPLGVALAPALLLFTLLRYKQHRLRPLAPLGIWGLGLVAVAFITNVAATAVVNLHPRAFYQWIVVEKLSVHNIFAYANDMVVSHLYPFPWDRANDAFHALTVALMIVGLTAWVAKNHRNFVFLFALSYGLMLVIMPIQQPRYLWPLYPVFVFGMLNGARIFVAFLTKRPQLAASGTLAFAIALVPPAGWNVVNDPRPVDLADLPDVSELIHYLEQRPDADHLRVTFFKPRTLGWTTGIPTMGPPRGQPHCILGELGAREITHVIIGSVYSGQNSHLRETIRVSPERFSKQFENSTFSVYAFRRGNDALTYQQNPECQRP